MKCPRCGSKLVMRSRAVLLNETSQPIRDTVKVRCCDCGHEGTAHSFGGPMVKPKIES